MNLKTESVNNGNPVVVNLTGLLNADQLTMMRPRTLDSIRVLIVDEHILVRAGIRSLLEKLPEVEIIAEARDGLEALSMVDEYEPEIVMMELAIPNVNGLEVTKRLAVSHPNVKVIILSTYSDQEKVGEALRAGVSGYLFKSRSMEDLEVAVTSVARGETYLSPQVSKAIIDECLQSHGLPRLSGKLSTRQRQVLVLIARGETTKQIALNLGISVKTVETHRARLMESLDIHDVAGLVRYAIKIGLANTDS
jgi:DNA-binding NarL/FixJ family response regulator